MLADRRVGQEIDPVDEQALAGDARYRQKPFHRRGGIFDAGGVTNGSKQFFGDAAFAVGHLQHGLAGDLVDGRLKRAGKRAVDDGDGDDHRDTERDAEKSQRRSQAVAACVAPRDRAQKTEHHAISFSIRPSRK